MRTFTVKILAADHVFYEGECASVIFPAQDGLYGIMADHSPMISSVVPGEMRLRLPNEDELAAAVGVGMVKVRDNHVLFLVDTIERPEEIDENRARRAAEIAQEKLLLRRSRRDYELAQANLARELNRLRVKNHSGDRH